MPARVQIIPAAKSTRLARLTLVFMLEPEGLMKHLWSNLSERVRTPDGWVKMLYRGQHHEGTSLFQEIHVVKHMIFHDLAQRNIEHRGNATLREILTAGLARGQVADVQVIGLVLFLHN